MDVVDKWYKGYGESPNQGRLHEEGNAYIRSEFPKMDFIQTCNRLTVTTSEENLQKFRKHRMKNRMKKREKMRSSSEESS
jgi:hypothetical protein